MFTGIIQAVGAVAELRPTPTGARIRIDPLAWGHRPSVGDSISIRGCCLTVADDARPLTFDAVHETLAKTTLGALAQGDRVHLEHAATPETLLGGHVVQGHVDGVAEVLQVHAGDDYRITFAPPPELMRFVSPKGSVAIDGVSLTVAALAPHAPRPTFQVALIPTTLERTTLASLRQGDKVNFEADMLNKMVVHYLQHYTH